MNPTSYEARVELAGSSRRDWISLATVPPGSQVVLRDVYDQGATWVFRFGYLHFQEQLEVPRTRLAADGWQVTVPTSFESRLRAQGVSPPP